LNGEVWRDTSPDTGGRVSTQAEIEALVCLTSLIFRDYRIISNDLPIAIGVRSDIVNAI
jgi:hypothetical protein